MSISNKIFESVAFKSEKELKESVETEQFIKTLKDGLSKVAKGNSIEGFATPEGCQLTFAIDGYEPNAEKEILDTIKEICPNCVPNINLDRDNYVTIFTIDVAKPVEADEECDKVNEAGASLNIGADVDIPDELASTIGTALLASEEGETEEPAEEEPTEEPKEEIEIKISDDKVEIETNKEVEVEVPAEVPAEEVPTEKPIEDSEKICEKCGKAPCECVDKEINDFLESAYEDEEKEESEQLEEIGPLAAGLIGAGAGAVLSNIVSSKDESEEVTEAEVPASKVDFAHTKYEEVTNDIKTISELKSQDTENELYTDLLKAYDGVLKILKDYISEQPISEPVETPAEEPVEVQATEVEVEPEEVASVEGE